MPVNIVVKSRAFCLAAAIAAGLAGSAAAQSNDPPPQPEPVAGPVLGTTTPVRVVSLRAAPSSDAPAIGTLHPGDQLQILANAGFGWTQVRSATATGWAYGGYLASGIAAPSGSVVPASAAAPSGGTRGIISP